MMSLQRLGNRYGNAAIDKNHAESCNSNRRAASTKIGSRRKSLGNYVNGIVGHIPLADDFGPHSAAGNDGKSISKVGGYLNVATRKRLTPAYSPDPQGKVLTPRAKRFVRGAVPLQ